MRAQIDMVKIRIPLKKKVANIYMCVCVYMKKTVTFRTRRYSLHFF